jgi:hypothetical protein
MRSITWVMVIGIVPAFAVAVPYAKADPPGCQIDLSSPRIHAAIRSVPAMPYDEWNTEPRSFDGNYSQCATLSTVVIRLRNASAGSPRQALLFHEGVYVGTATPTPYHYLSWNPDQTSDDTVALDYGDPQGCGACPGPITTVHFQWQADHVVMLDGPPPESERD